MISISVFIRGKYGVRLIENIKKNSNFKLSYVEIPEKLPEFIEEPEEFVESLNIDKKIFSSQLLILYTLHPDITPEIIKLAGKNKVKAIIIAGGISKAGGYPEILELSKRYNIHIEIHEICCEIEKNGNEIIDEFASLFGKPELKITTKNGYITDIKVIRSSPCGSTFYSAHKLIGAKTKDAPSKAGLYVQEYPCKAVRGIGGGIHKAAELHKKSVEKEI